MTHLEVEKFSDKAEPSSCQTIFKHLIDSQSVGQQISPPENDIIFDHVQNSVVRPE